MELIFFILGAVCTIVVGVITNVLAHDIYLQAPSFAKNVLARAIRNLPETDRSRYAEEWLSHLCECEGTFQKFRHAVECLLISRKLAQLCNQRGAAQPVGCQFEVLDSGCVNMDLATAAHCVEIFRDIRDGAVDPDAVARKAKESVGGIVDDKACRVLADLLERAPHPTGFRIRFIDQHGRLFDSYEALKNSISKE